MAEQENLPTNSAGEQTGIPKHRLAEEVRKRMRLEAEVSSLRQVLNSISAPRGAPVQEQLHPGLAKLKEQDPEVYAYLREQELQRKQTNALVWDAKDQQDRMDFLALGKEAQKRLGEVEDILEQQRAQGNFYSRGQILRLMKGEEALLAEREPKPVPKEPTPNPAAQNVDAPPAQVLPQAMGSTASPAQGSATLEDLERRLLNVQF